VANGSRGHGIGMTKSHDSDEWLMGQVARGKRELLAPLVRRYSSPLLTFIDRMVGNRHRAEELFQEVFLAVWVKRRQYRFPRTFRSWLFAIAANRCKADYRHSKPPAATFDETSRGVPVAAGKGPAETAVETETATLVATAVAQLPPQQRSVVVLRVWNGLSFAEIAESLGCAEGTVRSHMHHGLTGMRKYLEPRI
jgi:RNA polymerase sigma-70 factor (ECF subfamily)